jgi:hypothetical protein
VACKKGETYLTFFVLYITTLYERRDGVDNTSGKGGGESEFKSRSGDLPGFH